MNEINDSTKRGCKILTLDARAMINLYERKDGKFDLNDMYVRDAIRKSADMHSGSALFDQIIFARKKLFDQLENEALQLITRDLVYLDFGNGIKGIEEGTKELVESGFSLMHQGENDYIEYIPFEKSASMSRQNVLSFINKELFEEVDERLRLGINWNKVSGINPTKYYAYRGLYMTDAKRIDTFVCETDHEKNGIESATNTFDSSNQGGEFTTSEKIVLNEKTLLVLHYDDYDLNENINAITIDETKREGNTIKITKDFVLPKKSIKVTPYDGEGIISRGYADIIRRQLPVIKGDRATSFQIRMPFTKGMLHEVDFRRFILEELYDYTGVEEWTEEQKKNALHELDLEIEDAFGIMRKLCDVEIIMTDSMFKSCKWLCVLYGEKIANKWKCTDTDALKIYFNGMQKYNHALYIGNTNANIRPKEQIRFNYQFFSTLDMDGEAFDQLVKKHIDFTNSLRTNPQNAVSALLNCATDEAETAEDEETMSTRPLENWEEALKENEAFLYDPKIQEEIKRIEEARTKGLLRGQVYVDGTMKYLSMDLLGFLYNIAQRCNIKPPVKYEFDEERNNKERYKYRLDKERLHSDKFFVSPECAFKKAGNHYRLEKSKYYGVLRNPHLSRNEQCALKPYIPKEYDNLGNQNLYYNYFRHLRGVIMVGYNSDSPAALSGADFDGDMVKISFEDSINEAIVTGVYDVKDEHLVRKMPIACIPSMKSVGDKPIATTISFDEIKKTFSSRVGKISNKAVEIGRIAYNNNDSSSIDSNSVALCTIATGLEIDSVKTGVTPDITELEKLCKRDTSGFMAAYRGVKKFLENAEINTSRMYGRVDEQRRKAEVYYKKDNKENTIFSVDPSPEINIDKLIYHFIDQSETQRSHRFKYLDKEGNEISKCCFEFQIKDDWREKTKTSYCNEIELLRPVIGAYRKLNADTWSVNRHRNQNYQNKANVLTLLKIRYDHKLGHGIRDLVDLAYEELLSSFESPEEVNSAITRMREKSWQFVVDKYKRKSCLYDIIGDKSDELSEIVIQLLCDTYDNGYQLLNYMLEDIKQLVYREFQENLPPEHRDSRFNRDYDQKFYSELYKASFSNMDLKNSSEWKREACKICRDKVLSIFDGDVYKAITCTVALDKGNGVMDEKHSFLWGVFTNYEIMKVIHKVKMGDDSNA